MRHDQRTRLAEVFVTAGMIAMEMGIDQVLRRIAAGRLDRGNDFFGQRRELVIDHEAAVAAVEQADITALPGQHIDIATYLRGHDFYRIDLLRPAMQRA